MSANARTRSRRGCMTCRRRKVKCDEHRPTCSSCRNLRLPCEWSAGERSSTAPLQRSRNSKACRRCSLRRMKCESVSSSDVCRACQTADTACEPQQPAENSQAERSGGDSPSALPSAAEVERLLKAYFTGPHHFCFYAFIHPGTFQSLYKHDRIPDALLLIMLATGLRCQEPDNSLADGWADRSRLLIMDDASLRMSALNLQALLLLVRYQWHRGSHASASLLSAMAARMAYALHLDEEPDGSSDEVSSQLPAVVKETRRRLMWSTFVMETVPDAGGYQPALPDIDPATITIGLPGDDFTEGWILHSSCLEDVSSRLVSLLIIRQRILRYSVAYHPRSNLHAALEQPWSRSSRFNSLLSDMQSWEHDLPTSLQFTEQGLLQYSGCLNPFLTLHCAVHASYTDLFAVGYFLRRRLRDPTAAMHQDPPDGFLRYCTENRERHAEEILRIISRVRPMLKHVMDPWVSVCAGVAFRILALEQPPGESTILQWPHLEHKHAKVAFECLKSTARWSQPIQRLLTVLEQFATKRAFTARLDFQPQEPGQAAQLSDSIPPSPTLRNLGTDATIERSLKMSDTELLLPDQAGSGPQTAARDRAEDALNELPSQAAESRTHEALLPDVGAAGQDNLHSPLDPVASELLDFWTSAPTHANDAYFDLDMWIEPRMVE